MGTNRTMVRLTEYTIAKLENSEAHSLAVGWELLAPDGSAQFFQASLEIGGEREQLRCVISGVD